MTPVEDFRDCYSRAAAIARETLVILTEAREGIEATYLAGLESPARELMRRLCAHLRLATPGLGAVPPEDGTSAKGVLEAAQAAHQARLNTEAENLRIWGEARAAAVSGAHETVAIYGQEIERHLRSTSNFDGSPEQMAPKFLAALSRERPSGIVGKLRDGEAAEAHQVIRHAPRAFQYQVEGYCTALEELRDPYRISGERLTQICVEKGLPTPKNPQTVAETAAVDRLLDIGLTAAGRLYLAGQMARISGDQPQLEVIGALEQAAIARQARRASSFLLEWNVHRVQFLKEMAERMLMTSAHWPEYLDVVLDVPGVIGPFDDQQQVTTRLIDAAWAVAALAASQEVQREIVPNKTYGAATSIDVGIQILSLIASKDPKAAYAIGLTAFTEQGVSSLLYQMRSGGANPRHQECLEAFEEGRTQWLAQFSGAEPSLLLRDMERQRDLSLGQ